MAAREAESEQVECSGYAGVLIYTPTAIAGRRHVEAGAVVGGGVQGWGAVREQPREHCAHLVQQLFAFWWARRGGYVM